MKKQKKIKAYDEDVVVKMYRLSIERIDRYEKKWYCDFMIADLDEYSKEFLKKEFLKACEKIIDKYLEEKYDSCSSDCVWDWNKDFLEWGRERWVSKV